MMREEPGEDDPSFARHVIDFLLDGQKLGRHLAQLRSGERSNPTALDLLSMFASKAAEMTAPAKLASPNGEAGGGGEHDREHDRRKEDELRRLAAQVLVDARVPVSSLESRLPVDQQWLVLHATKQFFPSDEQFVIVLRHRWALRAAVRHPQAVLDSATSSRTSPSSSGSAFHEALEEAVQQTTKRMTEAFAASDAGGGRGRAKRAKVSQAPVEPANFCSFIELAEYQLFTAHYDAANSIVQQLNAHIKEVGASSQEQTRALQAVSSALSAVSALAPGAGADDVDLFFADHDDGFDLPVAAESAKLEPRDAGADAAFCPLTMRSLPVWVADHGAPESGVTGNEASMRRDGGTTTSRKTLRDAFLHLLQVRSPAVAAELIESAVDIVIERSYALLRPGGDCLRDSRMVAVHLLIAVPSGAGLTPLPASAARALAAAQSCLTYLSAVASGAGDSIPLPAVLAGADEMDESAAVTPFVHAAGTVFPLLNSEQFVACGRCLTELTGQEQLVAFVSGLLILAHHQPAAERHGGHGPAPAELEHLSHAFLACMFRQRAFVGGPLLEMLHSPLILARLAGFLMAFCSEQMACDAPELMAHWGTQQAVGMDLGLALIGRANALQLEDEAAAAAAAATEAESIAPVDENENVGEDAKVAPDGNVRQQSANSPVSVPRSAHVFCQSWPNDPVFVDALLLVTTRLLTVERANAQTKARRRESTTTDEHEAKLMNLSTCASLVIIGLARNAIKRRRPIDGLSSLIEVGALACAIHQQQEHLMREQAMQLRQPVKPRSLGWLQHSLTRAGLEQLIHGLAAERRCLHALVLCQFVEPQNSGRLMALDLLRASNPLTDLSPLQCVTFLFDVPLLEHVVQLATAAGCRQLVFACMEQLQAPSTNRHNPRRTSVANAHAMVFVQQILTKLL